MIRKDKLEEERVYRCGWLHGIVYSEFYFVKEIKRKEVKYRKVGTRKYKTMPLELFSLFAIEEEDFLPENSKITPTETELKGIEKYK